MNPVCIQTPNKSMVEEKGLKKKKLVLQPLNTTSCNMFDDDAIESPTTVHVPSHPISKINDYLFVGSLQGAKDLTILKKYGITDIINISSIRDTNFYKGEFKYNTIDIKDSQEEDIKRFFPTLVQYIENIRNEQGKVLIHCYAGISRGPTVAMSYLIWKQELSYQEAYKVVKDARGAICPNAGFVYKLLEWEIECKKERQEKRLVQEKELVEYHKVSIIQEKNLQKQVVIELDEDTEQNSLSAALERSMSFEEKKRKRDDDDNDDGEDDSDCDFTVLKKKQRKSAECKEEFAILERAGSSSIQRVPSDIIAVY